MLDRVGDVAERMLAFIDSYGEPAPDNGSNVNRVNLEKIPRFGSHWKYRLPETQPSFLPLASSNTMPAQSPGAKCVSPMNAI